jgi:hypothetical protein
MTAPHPRLIITINDGLISGIYADGIDLSHVTAIVVDYDTDGADAEDGVVDVGGTDAFFGPHDITDAGDEMSSDIRRAYDTWALT